MKSRSDTILRILREAAEGSQAVSNFWKAQSTPFSMQICGPRQTIMSRASSQRTSVLRVSSRCALLPIFDQRGAWIGKLHSVRARFVQMFP